MSIVKSVTLNYYYEFLIVGLKINEPLMSG